MSLSIWQILLVVVLFILLFGRGRIPALMTDLAAGIKSFKQGMTESEPAAAAVTPVQQVQQVQPAQPSLESTQAEPATVDTTAQQRSL